MARHWHQTASIGIDLGTANVRIYVQGQGILLSEPAVIAVNRNTGEMLAAGEEAYAMIGRTPANVAVVRPIKDGVISSYHDTERMLRHYLRKVIGRRLIFKPNVMVCVPSGVTEVERRALMEVTEEAGARRAGLIEEPLAAAIGAGLDIASANGSMVVDIGGGTTDAAVISLGGMVVHRSVKVAGCKLDEAMMRYLKREYRMLIGEMTAEQIKMNIGLALPERDAPRMEIAGRSATTGLPTRVTLSASDTIEAFEETFLPMMETVQTVLERTPPELCADVAANGICLTGGGALLSGIDRLVSAKTGLHCYVAEDAISCVAIGTGLAAEHMDMMPSATEWYASA
jgi:rod shape-determining protein MreB and related proteins